MRRGLLLVVYLFFSVGLFTSARAQIWRIGIVLEGQFLPFGIAGFWEVQQGTQGFHGQVGWDYFGGFYVSGEVFYEFAHYKRMALGLVLYPGEAQVAPDLSFTGPMLFPSIGARREGTGWGYLGLGLPLDISYYRSLHGGLETLFLLRTRVQIVPLSRRR